MHNCEVCNDEQLQEALNDYGTHFGMCSSCGFYCTLSNDDGYCGDCN